jgi:hypothetical protein
MRRAVNTPRSSKFPLIRNPRVVTTGPNQFRANPEVTRRYRFTSTSATLTAISPALLLNASGVLAATAILGYQIFQSVKVRMIEIWTPPASQGAAATCSVLFPVATNTQAREVSDTTVSVSQPAHVRCGPPANSLAGFWNGTTGTTMFSLVAPPGSVIDVTISLVMGDNSVSTSVVLVGATIGRVYYCALDSGTAAGSIYPPVSLTQL